MNTIRENPTTTAIVTLRANSIESIDTVVKSDASLEVTKKQLRDSAQEIRDRKNSEELSYKEISELLSKKTGYNITITRKFEVRVE